jgi:hypothetical protein
LDWQGAILSLDGTQVGDTLADGKTVRGTIADAKSGGLWHPNCRHNLLPYVESIEDAIKRMQKELGKGSIWRKAA